MEFIAQSKMLGSPLSVIEIYEYYDIPSLFSCISSSGNIYLVLSVDEDEDSLTWFYLPVSSGRLDEIRSGETDLYDAFKKAEDGYLYEVITSYEDNVAVRYCKDVADDYLPTRGYRLSIPEYSSESASGREHSQLLEA